MVKSSKKVFDGFEMSTVYDVKFKGRIKEVSELSIDFVLRLKAKGESEILERAFEENNQQEVDILELLRSGIVSGQLIFQLEGKIQGRSETGFFTKGKAASVIDITSNLLHGNHLLKRKAYTSYQTGLQLNGSRLAYTQWNSLDPDMKSYVVVFKDKKVGEHKDILLPKPWKIEGVTQCKKKTRLRFKYRKIEQTQESRFVPQQKSRYIPRLFYLGVLSSIGIGIAHFYDLSIPFFDQYESAYVITLLLVGLGLARWSYKKGNKSVASGIPIITYGALAAWQHWNIPVVNSYELLLVIGTLLVILGLAPGLIGWPAVIAGILWLLSSIGEAYENGFNAVLIQDWLWPVALLAIGRWLIKRHDRLDGNGRFKDH